MTELSFLLELVFSYKLPKLAKEAIIGRIKEIESKSNQSTTQCVSAWPAGPVRPPKTAQSPSTQRILDEMVAEGIPLVQPLVSPSLAELSAPISIAQTPAAEAALAARAEAIRIATSGVVEKGRKSPRKF
jgi:hypothetical protein